jgi:alpha-N-acetylglucosaminidase
MKAISILKRLSGGGSGLVLGATLFCLPGWSAPAAGAAAEDARTAASGLVQRLLPREATRFVVEIIPPDPGGDVFEIESREGKIVLRGNNGVSVASALNWYLKYHCHCHHSFTGGSQLRLPEPLPPVAPKVRQVATARHRYFLNYCCFGYSLPWFDWAQWERLIDWMALNGIDLPLSVTGQEAVWQAVGRRMGWSDEDMRQFLAGPPYLPFGWMGCLDGHGGPLSQAWIDRHAALEKQILERERALGMSPALQGFTGHMPRCVTNQFPNARLQPIAWAEWKTQVLDPLDPLFPRLAAAFMEEQQKLFGSNHFYAADTFIEMIPPSGETNYLAGIGRAIFDGMNRSDPQACWVLQGWPFFFARNFWTQPRIEAVLGPVPDERMLVLDLYCEQTPVWSRTRAFCGKPWAWCNIQNFGNRVWLGGALDLINRDLFAARRDPRAARLSGLGFANEGLDNNPVVFDLMFELAWRSEPVALDSWLRDFSRRSYGKANPEAEKAWQALHETAFQKAFDNNAAYTAAPSLSAPGGSPYSNERLAQAWQRLLAAADDVGAADPFRFDLVNVTRQVLGNHSAELHLDVIEAFQKQDRQAFQQASEKMLTLIRELDELLATRPEFLLGNWLEDARGWGATDAERDRLGWNARRVLTLWGNTTVLRDYACRQWSGLLNGFYLKRWELFYRHLDAALAAEKPFDPKAFAAEMFAFEKSWSEQHDRHSRQPRGDSIAISRRLWAKYQDAFKPEVVSLTTGKKATCSSALPGNPASLANDGHVRSTESFWATDVVTHPGPAWWQVDFEKETTVGRVVVIGYFGDKRYYGFTVEVSKDGQQWELVADRRENKELSTRQGYTCRFEPRACRYLRITQTHNSANSGRHLVEVLAFEK